MGALLACASSDGKVSVLEFKDDGTWDTKVFNAHGMGCNAVAWAPAIVPGSLVSTQSQPSGNVKRLATGGCDNVVKIWGFKYATSHRSLTMQSREKYLARGGCTARAHGLGSRCGICPFNWNAEDLSGVCFPGISTSTRSRLYSGQNRHHLDSKRI